jgi:predicted RNA binding protein YcfA (HicA-like mRNA interferase family)
VSICAVEVSILLPSCMTAREIVKVLKQDGWVIKNQRGSHLQMMHHVKKGKVTIPMHNGDIDKGTLKSILKQAGIRSVK